MNLYVRTPQGRIAQAHHVGAMLGLPNGRVPVEGFPKTVLDGIEVWAEPLVPNPWVKRNFQGLRVRAKCPVCGKEVALGRLAQHAVIHRGLE